LKTHGYKPPEKLNVAFDFVAADFVAFDFVAFDFGWRSAGVPSAPGFGVMEWIGLLLR
jgi:hypothetical protein